MRRGTSLLLLFIAVAAPALIGQSASPATSVLSSRDLTLDPPDGGGFFRFLPGGQWINFDRPLVLTAAPGEDRSYSLQLRGRDRASGDSADAAGEIRAYRIDKRPPASPQAKPAGGLFHSPLTPTLSTEPGSLVHWALIGSDSAPDFQTTDKAGPPNLAVPAVGAATYTLLAYAEDDAGNRSPLARFVYRLAPSGFPATTPAAEAPGLPFIEDETLTPPQSTSGRGATELSAPTAQSAGTSAPSKDEVLFLDVNPASSPRSPDDFVRVGAAEESVQFRITCPYGWTGSIPVYYGYLSEEGLRFNPRPLSIALAWEPEAAPAPPVPAAPELVVDPVGRGAFLSFPEYDGTIYLSVDGSPERAYSGPFPLQPMAERARVSWVGEDAHGRRSAGSETLLQLPPRVPELSLVGAGEGESIGHDVSLAQSAPGVLRYEIGSAGDPPAEPSGSSPLLKGSLPVSCPPGQMRVVLIRYRSFLDSGANSPGGEEKTLSFVLDKRPPSVPSLLSSKSPHSDKALALSFAPEPRGVSIFASISTDTESGPYAPVTGPLELPGSESGPVDYLIKAYAVDSLGNRSADMQSVTVVVDRDSVYAAEGAAADGDGSPGRPFSTLDAALRAVETGHKKSINLQGTLALASSFVLHEELSLVGGFAADWSRDSSARAKIVVASQLSAAALTLQGSTLRLRGVELRSSGGAAPLIDAVDGASVQVESSTLRSAGGGDSLMLRLMASTLDVRTSTVMADSGMSCTFVEARDSRISFSGSILKVQQQVRAFSAFSLSGGTLSISSSLFTSSADLALRLLDLRGTKLEMLRSLVEVNGGSGYMRLGSFADVGGEIRDCKFDVTWHGDATLFEISGRAPAFRYDSILAETSRGGLRYFVAEGSELEVWNSILSCTGGGSELVRSDEALRPGSFVADCIWGFSKLASGATEATSLEDFDAINAGSPRFSSTRHVAEPPRDTFAAPVKSVSPLNPASRCIGAALPIDEQGAVDFQGRPRPGLADKIRPDIGADELSE